MIPNYPHESICNLSSLYKALGITEQQANNLRTNSSSFYFLTHKKVKPDNSIRYTYDVRPELKSVHERICAVLLRKVEYPDFLKGSIKGRDYLSNCAEHTGKKIVISEDVTNFFPSVKAPIVYQMWIGVFGMSHDVAKLLTELVCFEGGLVQGAKPSSFICNLILWKREARLVNELKSKGLTYTRYVDDITVSSSGFLNKKEIPRIISKIYGMLSSIGVKPNRKKHCIMPSSKKQDVHRINVNSNLPTLPKKKRKIIRAIVYRCSQADQSYKNTAEYRSMYNSALGKVNNLRRMHPKEGKQLLEILNNVKPIIS
ncbi:reverse transcriptase family protein [Psychrosphaera haliotis]|uniref:reverse transcriptase family protein n=1 Tax=Psychrosphaera haliotis TaxID=555083 RepID=UPI0031D22EAB